MTGKPKNRIKQAEETFQKGFSCSQAVLSVFSSRYGLDRDLALKISQPFGGGIAHLGKMCGAVSGALLVIGLEHGRIRVEDNAAKQKTYDLVREFLDRFENEHGSLLCRDLLGYDINDPEDLKTISQNGLFTKICPGLVKSSVIILEEILNISDRSK